MDLFGRRAVIRGGALAGATALAGCLGGESPSDEAGDDGTESPETPELTLTNVTFTDGEPSGYQQFEAVDDTTFAASETVWIYFEPTGFGRESAGDGESEVEIEMGISVTGPDGAQLSSDRDTLTRTSPTESPVYAYFAGHFQPPVPATGGEYTATLSATDAISGQTAEQTVTFTVEASRELAIDNVTFLADRPRGYRDFDTQPGGTYTMLDAIWVYFEPTGFATESAGEGAVSVDLTTDIEITGPNGQLVYTNQDSLSQSFAEEDRDEYFVFWNADLPLGLEPGTYTVEVGVEDRLTERTASADATFDRELARYAEYADNFRTTIESNLNITVTGGISGNPAELVYDSAVAADTEAAVGQLEYVAGAFAGTVGNGWPVDGLVANATGADGTRYSYRVETDTALRFIADEITADEYREVVLSTVQRQ